MVPCDYCGNNIRGVVTNVGDSMEVILACSDCVSKLNEVKN